MFLETAKIPNYSMCKNPKEKLAQGNEIVRVPCQLGHFFAWDWPVEIVTSNPSCYLQIAWIVVALHP